MLLQSKNEENNVKNTTKALIAVGIQRRTKDIETWEEENRGNCLFFVP